MRPPISCVVVSTSGASDVTVTASVSPPTSSLSSICEARPTSRRTSRCVYFLKLASSAVTSYIPGVMPLTRNEPSSLLTVSRNNPLSWCRTTMATPGSTPPCESMTRPRRSAVPCWANAGAVNAQTLKNNNTKRRNMGPPGLEKCDRQQGDGAATYTDSEPYRQVRHPSRQSFRDVFDTLRRNAAWSVADPLRGFRRRGSDLRSRLDATADALPRAWARRRKRRAGRLHGWSRRGRGRRGTNGGTAQSIDSSQGVRRPRDCHRDSRAADAIRAHRGAAAARGVVCEWHWWRKLRAAPAGDQRRLTLRAGRMHGRDVSNRIAMDGADGVNGGAGCRRSLRRQHARCSGRCDPRRLFADSRARIERDDIRRHGAERDRRGWRVPDFATAS